MGRKILVLGPDNGWHADRLRQAAKHCGDHIEWARYESVAARLSDRKGRVATCEVGDPPRRLALEDFDHVLSRTMPNGSLEEITFRLSVLHEVDGRGPRVTNSAASMEIAIDKYRTLSRIDKLGFPVPETEIVQSRREGLEAFDRLGGDVVVKPLFGGEGRGVMRIRDRELAWTTFTTLERLAAVIYVQAFVSPGGVDTRLLVIGDQVHAIRRFANEGWKTNVARGGRSVATTPCESQRQMALSIARDIGLTIAAIDLLDSDHGPPRVVEVNAVPGWKGAEGALGIDLATEMLAALPISLPAAPRQASLAP
jgi:ribosomal protein S6--L-glutamate ligase